MIRLCHGRMLVAARNLHLVDDDAEGALGEGIKT